MTQTGMNNKDGRGGRREGAGRKRKEDAAASVTLAFRVTPEMSAELESVARQQSKSRSECIVQALRMYFDSYK